MKKILTVDWDNETIGIISIDLDESKREDEFCDSLKEVIEEKLENVARKYFDGELLRSKVDIVNSEYYSLLIRCETHIEIDGEEELREIIFRVSDEF